MIKNNLGLIPTIDFIVIIIRHISDKQAINDCFLNFVYIQNWITRISTKINDLKIN